MMNSITINVATVEARTSVCVGVLNWPARLSVLGSIVVWFTVKKQCDDEPRKVSSLVNRSESMS